MNYKKAILLLTVASLTLCNLNAQTMRTIDKTTVSELDIGKYLGTWYEIARYPHSFEKNLQGVTATYSLKKNGKIKVVNKGYKNTLQGKKSVAVGKAKRNKNGEPGQLKVSFFGPFYGDYYVLELDKEYQWALIGSKSDNFLWILSRTNVMDEEDYQFLIKRAKERGYDLTRLQIVEH